MSSFWMAVFYKRPYPGTHGLEVAYDWVSFNASAHEDYEGWTGAVSLAFIISARQFHDSTHDMCLPLVYPIPSPGTGQVLQACMLHDTQPS